MTDIDGMTNAEVWELVGRLGDSADHQFDFNIVGGWTRDEWTCEVWTDGLDTQLASATCETLIDAVRSALTKFKWMPLPEGPE